MKSWIAVLVTGLSIVGAGRAFAQESAAGPGTVEVSIIPGGVPSIQADQGAELRQLQPWRRPRVQHQSDRRIEGEVGGTLGISQNLQFGGSRAIRRAQSTELRRQPRGVGANRDVGGAIRHRRSRRSHDVPASQSRRDRHRNVPDGQRWRRPQVVRAERSLGPSRRLSIHWREGQRQRAGLLRSGNAVRTSRLRRRGHQRRPVNT